MVKYRWESWTLKKSERKNVYILNYKFVRMRMEKLKLLLLEIVQETNHLSMGQIAALYSSYLEYKGRQIKSVCALTSSC